jgi:hypothetical protein
MRRLICAFLLCAACAAQAVRAQEPRPAPAADEEVLRVNTVLVQTGVRVYDRARRPKRETGRRDQRINFTSR